MTVSWYPGHMAKAKRLLEAQLARADIVLEVCDARIPVSSRNPQLAAMADPARTLVVLNKADLAAPETTGAWLSYFRGRGQKAVAVSSVKSAAPVLSALREAAQAREERDRRRGIRGTLRAVVVGVPNTGKSSLINRLSGAALRTEDRPGVTRASQWVRVSPYLELMDSPGLLWPRLDDPRGARRLAYVASIREGISDRYLLALSLAEELLEVSPRAFLRRFRLQDPGLRGQALMEAVCKERGFLLRQGEADLDRAAMSILEEFRSGKIGRISLERPPTVTEARDENHVPEG